METQIIGKVQKEKHCHRLLCIIVRDIQALIYKQQI